MCGRASGSRGPAALAAATGSRRFLAAARYRPSYNLGPTNTLPVLRRVLTKHHTHNDTDADVESKEEEQQQEEDVDVDVSRDDHSMERDRKYNREDEDDYGDGDGDRPSGSPRGGGSRDSSTRSNSRSSTSSTLSSSSGSSSSSSSGAPADANAPDQVGDQHTLETDLNTMEPDFKGLDTGDLILQSMSWGLVPFYTAKDQIHSTGYNMINARAETVAQKGTFKRLLSRHRCVVVVDGYYEWHTSTNKLGQVVKQPYFMQHKHRETKPIDTKDEDDELQSAPSSAVSSAADWVYPSALMYMAALWDRWMPKDGDTTSTPFYTVTILTTEPIQCMGWMHDRQPVILSAHQAAQWCDVENVPFSQVASFMSPHPLDLEWYPVTDTVSQIRNKSKECVEHKDVVMARRHATGLGRFFKPANASPSKATSDSSSSASSSSSTSTSTSTSSSSTSSTPTSSTSTSSDAPSSPVARAKSPVFVIDDDDFSSSPQKPQKATTSPSNDKTTAATNTFPSPRKPAAAAAAAPITKTTPGKKRKSAAPTPTPTGSQSITSMFAKISKKQKVDDVQSIRQRHRALMEED